MLSYADFVEAIPTVEGKVNYHFIRTEGGRYFDSFFKNNYVAIGYEEVTIQDVVLRNMDPLRAKVKRAIPPRKLEALTEKGIEGKISSIINTVRDFHFMKKGDVVVIPDNNSNSFAFGIVNSDHTEINLLREHHCPFTKRRGVKWIKQVPKTALHGRFQLIRTQRTLTSLNEMDDLIDPIISGVYQKDDSTFLRVKVTTEDPISLFELNRSLNAIEAMVRFQKAQGRELNDPTIQINLNSPGDVLIRLQNTAASVFVAFIIFTACNADADLSDDEVAIEIEQEFEKQNNPVEIQTDSTLQYVRAARALKQRLDINRNQ